MAIQDAELTSANAPMAAATMARTAVKNWMSNVSSFTINPETALYKTAQERNLGYPSSDEVHFEADGVKYVAQGYSDAVLYVAVGQWDQVQQA